MVVPDVEWRAVPGFDGYEVSDSGSVRSVDRVLVDRLGRSRIARGRQLRLLDFGNSLRVALRCDGRTRTVRVHRLVLAAFVGPCPDGLEVCHENGVYVDNRLANLRYDTRSSNQLDSVRHGSHASTKRVVCPRGHRLDAPNLVASLFGRGFRSCLACDRASSRITSARRRGRPVPDLRVLADELYEKIMSPSV